MSRQSRGAACVDAGGVYVRLMSLCERIELVGELWRGADSVDVIEYLIIPKSVPDLVSVLESEFGPLVSRNEAEIVFFYYDTRVELSITTGALFDAVLRAQRGFA